MKTFIQRINKLPIQFLISILLISSLNLIPTVSNAQNWSAFPTGGANDWVYASCIYNGDLIVAGKFTSIGGVSANHIARWNGTAWSPLGLGVNAKVWSLAVYNGKLYVGGEFTMAGGQAMNFIARWNGSAWSNSAGDMGSIVSSMVVYNNKLIVGGYFTDADGTPANYIAQFNGNNWSSLGSGVSSQVMDLEVYNGQLVAGGFFTTAGGISSPHIAKWDGTNWSGFGTGISGIVYALTTHNNDLIAGGLFTSAGGMSANHIASWNGTSWSSLGGGMSGIFYQYVFALTSFNGKLIAGGYFTHSDGIMTNGISQWDGTSWSPIGSGLWYPANVYGAHTFCVYGTDLIVGGLFVNAGGVNTSHIAKVNFTMPGVSCNLKLFLQGFYTGSGLMAPALFNQGETSNTSISDSIDVELYDLTYSFVDASRTVLNTSGTASCSFPYANPGSYYIAIRHRNSLETWSATPITLSAIPVTYDFSTAASKAYGNNMIQVQNGVWALYTGELNYDGNIDLLDNAILENSIFNFDYGYIETDINGDGNVDLLDSPMPDDNINNFIYAIHP